MLTPGDLTPKGSLGLKIHRAKPWWTYKGLQLRLADRMRDFPGLGRSSSTSADKNA